MAAFGSFTFAANEYPLRGTYNGWMLSPSYDRSQPLGSTKDDIVYLARGSKALAFEDALTQARFDAAEALVGTVATFTDFDSPTPSARSALLMNLEVVGMITDTALTAVRLMRVRWTLVEQ